MSVFGSNPFSDLDEAIRRGRPSAKTPVTVVDAGGREKKIVAKNNTELQQLIAKLERQKKGGVIKSFSYDEPDTENFTVQMRKVINLRGRYKVHFNDGKTSTSITPNQAMAYLNKHDVSKPADKEMMQSRASSSEAEFKKVISEEKQDYFVAEGKEYNFIVDTGGELPTFIMKAGSASQVKQKLRKVIKKPDIIQDITRMTVADLRRRFQDLAKKAAKGDAAQEGVEEIDEAVKVGDTVKVKLNRKGREYIEKGKVIKIEKDSIIVKHDFSRTPSKVSMKNIVKEEVEEIDEVNVPNIGRRSDNKRKYQSVAQAQAAKVKKDLETMRKNQAAKADKKHAGYGQHKPLKGRFGEDADEEEIEEAGFVGRKDPVPAGKELAKYVAAKYGKKKPVKEEELDELGRDTLASYSSKASDARGHRKLPAHKVDNRYTGVSRAQKRLDKMQEEDDLDETTFKKAREMQAAKKGSKPPKHWSKRNEELEEGKMSQLHQYMQDGKSAEWIARKMKLDVKTIKALINEEDLVEMTLVDIVYEHAPEHLHDPLYEAKAPYKWDTINTALVNARWAPKRIAKLLMQLNKDHSRVVAKAKGKASISWDQLNISLLGMGISPSKIADVLTRMKHVKEENEAVQLAMENSLQRMKLVGKIKKQFGPNHPINKPLPEPKVEPVKEEEHDATCDCKQCIKDEIDEAGITFNKPQRKPITLKPTARKKPLPAKGVYKYKANEELEEGNILRNAFPKLMKKIDRSVFKREHKEAVKTFLKMRMDPEHMGESAGTLIAHVANEYQHVEPRDLAEILQRMVMKGDIPGHVMSEEEEQINEIKKTILSDKDTEKKSDEDDKKGEEGKAKKAGDEMEPGDSLETPQDQYTDKDKGPDKNLTIRRPNIEPRRMKSDIVRRAEKQNADRDGSGYHTNMRGAITGKTDDMDLDIDGKSETGKGKDIDKKDEKKSSVKETVEFLEEYLYEAYYGTGKAISTGSPKAGGPKKFVTKSAKDIRNSPYNKPKKRGFLDYFRKEDIEHSIMELDVDMCAEAYRALSEAGMDKDQFKQHFKRAAGGVKSKKGMKALQKLAKHGYKSKFGEDLELTDLEEIFGIGGKTNITTQRKDRSKAKPQDPAAAKRARDAEYKAEIQKHQAELQAKKAARRAEYQKHGVGSNLK